MSRYLEENPVYKEQGVSLSQFSFQIPRPLHENYLRKRSKPTSDAGDLGMSRFPYPSEGNFKLIRTHSSEHLH